MLPLDRVSALKADNKRLKILKHNSIHSTSKYGSAVFEEMHVFPSSFYVFLRQGKPPTISIDLIDQLNLFALPQLDSNQEKYRSNHITQLHMWIVEHI